MILAIVQKIEFDRICRFSLYDMDIQGGLTETTRTKLKTDLESYGFTEVLIEGTTQVQYGEWLNLKVTAGIKTKKWTDLLNFEEGTAYLTYERQIVSRQIHNMAF
jgi:hypothetical protein